ncbi:MAG: putative ribosomally synthesized peptide with SipW-like signal peptide [Halobacteriales archaeon]|jgi:predicted ribosomally synthesized peptide with SipW-like signal peptide
MTDKHTIDLTRRKVLAGLGAVGIASAGAGLGTSAYFSDQETFEDNLLVAGSFDLKVDYINRYYSDMAEETRDDPQSWAVTGSYPDPYEILSREEIESEEAFRDQFADDDDIEAALVSLDDVKPGDEGCLQFSLHLFDNPGYIWLYADNLVSQENGFTEPESTDPDEIDGEESGELEESIIVTVYYDENQDCEFDPETDTVIFGPGVGGFTDETGDNPATLEKAFEVMHSNNGYIPLDGDRSTPMDYDDGNTAQARDCYPNSTTDYVTFHWRLPVDHANEIQTDSVEFDLGFYAEQCRHNDGAGMLVSSFVTTQAFSGVDSQNCDFSDPIALPYGGLGDEQALTVDTSSDPVVFSIDLAKELVGGQYPDNFGLAFETDGDGLGDFQVGYTAGTGWQYESPVASGMTPGLPTGISGTADGAGQYTIEIDRSVLGTTFAIGGKAGYASETPPGGPGNVVVNFTPDFCFGPGGFDDASTYQEIDLL